MSAPTSPSSRAIAAACICQAVKDLAWFRQGGAELIANGLKHRDRNRRNDCKEMLQRVLSAVDFISGGGHWSLWCDVLEMDPGRASLAATRFIDHCCDNGINVGVEFQRHANRISCGEEA